MPRGIRDDEIIETNVPNLPSNGIHIKESDDAPEPVAGPSKGPHRLDTLAIDPPDKMLDDPNLVLDDIDHKIIDKLGDPTLIFDQIGTHYHAPNDDAMDTTGDGLEP